MASIPPSILQSKAKTLERAYRLHASPSSVPLQPTTTTTPPTPPVASTSAPPVKRKKRPQVQSIELEFTFQGLGFLTKAMTLWRKDKQPVDVYFKITYTNGTIRKVTTGPEQNYEHQISSYVPIDAFHIFPSANSHYKKFIKTIKQYRKQVTYRSLPSYGPSFLTRWCRTQFSDNESTLVIYQPHHFILNLLNSFHDITQNNRSKVPLLNIAENISLDDFYTHCQEIFVQEVV